MPPHEAKNARTTIIATIIKSKVTPPVTTPTIPCVLEFPFNDFAPKMTAMMAAGMQSKPTNASAPERSNITILLIPRIIDTSACFFCFSVISPLSNLFSAAKAIFNLTF